MEEKRRSVQRAKLCKVAVEVDSMKMAQEEYEDISEVLHPSTLSTHYMYVAWPRLNVSLVSA